MSRAGSFDIRWDSFNQGLRNRFSPDKIGPGAFQTALNVILRNGKAQAIDKAVLSTDAINTTKSIYDPIAAGILGFVELQNLGATFFEYNSIVYAAARSYVAGNAWPAKTADNSTWYKIGITPPSWTPTSADGGAGNIICTNERWVATYYSTTFDHESQPSAVSTPNLTLASRKADIGVTAHATANEHVNKIRVYRSVTSASDTLYYLTKEGNNANGTLTDNTAEDTSLPLLNTDNNDPPSASLAGFAGTYNDILFAWDGRTLYGSNYQQYNGWPSNTDVAFEWELPSAIIEARAIRNGGVLILTYDGAFLLSGPVPERMVWNQISETIKIACAGAICRTDFGIAFVSTDGLEIFDGTSFNRITTPLLSEAWVTTNLVADAANVVMGYTDRQIVVFTPSNSGKAVVFDLLRWPEVIVKQTDLAINTTSLGAFSGPSGLYFLRDDSSDRKIYQWAKSGGTQQTMQIHTNEVKAKSPGCLLNPRRVMLDYEGGPFTVDVYANGSLYDTHVAPSSVDREDPHVYGLPTAFAARWSIKVSGAGTVYEVALLDVVESDGWK